MADERDALHDLEQRVARLEGLIERLVARPAPGAAPRPAASPAPRPLPPPRPAVAPPPRTAPTGPAIDWEQWIGQRGLLAVGLLALLLTAGFFLKYAIEQGWISPLLRVVGGVVTGALLAAWGDRLARRKLIAYGAAVVGAGGGLAYLATWAATAPYRMLDPGVGLVALAGITLAVAVLASRHRVEALAMWALAGAFGAPFFVPQVDPDVTLLLGYLVVVAVAGGSLAFRHHWRWAFALATLGFLALPLPALGDAPPVATYIAYLGAGGALGLLATERRPWPEARLAWSFAPWVVLFLFGMTLELGRAVQWEVVVVGVLWATLAAVYHVRADPFAREDPVEIVVFVAAPIALVRLAAALGPPVVQAQGGVVPLLAAIGYAMAGWPHRVPSLVAMAFALAGLAVSGQLDGVAVALGWGGLAVGAVAVERRGGVRDGRTVGAVLGALAFLHLYYLDLLARPEDEAAFIGPWALAWYGVTGALGVCAAWWWTRAEAAAAQRLGPEVPWGLVGASVLIGGAVELHRVFASRLAGDLAISAYWIGCAGLLVWLGFARERRLIRSAGLAVSGLAALKIVLYDLANLEALYRVGSVFVLALITLAVAYAYNRRAAA